MKKMYINLVHRAENDLNQLDSLKFQQRECEKFGLKTTLLIGYPAMQNEEIVDFVKIQGAREDVELGISLHDISCEEIYQAIGSREKALYLLPLSSKEIVVQMVFEKFKETFGFLPSAIADYIIDANTLCFIKKNYPKVVAAITNCFEEGVKMFAGNCNGWMLFSDGGPWGAYYPSKRNHIVPAKEKEDYVGIVGLPHLNRDMVLSLTSRDDYFASHPINIMRAKANQGKESPYLYDFYDQWIRQTDYNGFSYYNVFVSTSWITKGYQGLFVENYLDARDMYTDMLSYYQKSCEKGEAQCLTMTEFVGWFERNIEIGEPEVNLWDEVLCGSKRQNFWYIDPCFRIAIDMNMGGTIVDLRPYVSPVNNNMGPDTDVKYNGNNPFIISSEHRNTEFTCYLEYKGKQYAIKDQRIKGSVVRDENKKHKLVLDPLCFEMEGNSVMLESSYIFQGKGKIQIERKITGLPQNEQIKVTEVFCGCLARTQYPEELYGAVLSVRGNNEIKEFTYTYSNKMVTLNSPIEAAVKIPQIETVLSLVAQKNVDAVQAEEGNMFYPQYYLRSIGLIGNQEEMVTCLQIEKM